MTMNLVTRDDTLTIHVPYDGVQADWGEEGIAVTIDIPSLLTAILPMGCLQNDGCRAAAYVTEHDRQTRVEKKSLSAPERIPATAGSVDDFCCGYEGGEGYRWRDDMMEGC